MPSCLLIICFWSKWTYFLWQLLEDSSFFNPDAWLCSIAMVITAQSECTQYCHCNVFVFWSSSHKGEICKWVPCFVTALFFSTSLGYFVLWAIRKLVCSVKTHRNKCICDKEKNKILKLLGLEVKYDAIHDVLQFLFLQGLDVSLNKVPTLHRGSLAFLPQGAPLFWRSTMIQHRLHSQARVEWGQEHWK